MMEVESTRAPDSGWEDGGCSVDSMTTRTSSKLSRSKHERWRGPGSMARRVRRAMKKNGAPKSEWCDGLSDKRILERRDRHRRTASLSLLEEFMLDTRRHESVPVEEMLALALKQPCKLDEPLTADEIASAQVFAVAGGLGAVCGLCNKRLNGVHEKSIPHMQKVKDRV